MDLTSESLQRIADANIKFYASAQPDLVTIKALLFTLLSLEKMRLVKEGVSPDEAEKTITDLFQAFQTLATEQKKDDIVLLTEILQRKRD